MSLTELDSPADEVADAASPTPARTPTPTTRPASQTASDFAIDLPAASGLVGLAALSAALSGCGGGSDAVGTDTGAGAMALRADATGQEIAAAGAAGGPVTPPVRPPARLTRQQASRFLSQAAFGGTAADIAQVQLLGFEGWLEAQFKLPLSQGYVSSISPGQIDTDNREGRQAVERALWRKFVSSPDVLRQRVSLALTEIFVISINPVVVSQRGYACAAFMDVLEGNAFSNYRDLLTQVSRTAAMGSYLTYRGNKKADPKTGSQPDENYARELMQLFSIGLFKLKIDGTQEKDANDKPIDSYTQDDVLGMARVFTGWDLTDVRPGPNDLVTTPMRQIARNHELGEKKFLGTTIPANTDGFESLDRAINALMTHPSIAPFIARQLIQRLVTSNPSPAYVARVAQAFKGKNAGENGDMKNTLRAVLLDPEAMSAASLSNPQRGKVREPMVRFLQWARTFKLKAPEGGLYNFGDLTSPVSGLAQSPLRSPSVFNFFRPGFVPSAAGFGASGITAPEFQITTEISVAGYLNFMQEKIANGIAGLRPDYGDLLPLVADAAALLAELNVLLAAGQLSAATLGKLKTALDSITTDSTAGKNNRIRAAVMLVMAAPEYIVQK
jgi:uncharacterized protein (DUF1800 family)